MATSPVPLWAQEMSPYHHGPTGAGVLALAVVAVLVALLIQVSPSTESGESARQLGPACSELQRLERRGVDSGATWRRTTGACRKEATSDGR
jgi:hypothetical protein